MKRYPISEYGAQQIELLADKIAKNGVRIEDAGERLKQQIDSETDLGEYRNKILCVVEVISSRQKAANEMLHDITKNVLAVADKIRRLVSMRDGDVGCDGSHKYDDESVATFSRMHKNSKGDLEEYMNYMEMAKKEVCGSIFLHASEQFLDSLDTGRIVYREKKNTHNFAGHENNKEEEQLSLLQKSEDISHVDMVREHEALEKMKASERSIYSAAVQREPRITSEISTIVKSCGGTLRGLENRVKSPSSTYSKMYENTPKTSIKSMGDIIRYTALYSEENLAKGTNKCLHRLKTSGYGIKRVKNTWLDENAPYKGINVNLSTPDGQKFEMQFHTEESFNLKNGELHSLYADCRKLPPDSLKAIAINDKMVELSSQLHCPKDIYEVKSI